MLETRWFDCGSGYCVLVMDPDTSGLTWEQVAASAGGAACCGSPQVFNGVLFVATWGYEENREDAEAHAAYLEMCKVETVRLAELAFAPKSPPVVTLSP